MSQPLPRALSQDSTDGIRKRVGKACDRCRLKKSKCDGAHPCSRCKTDNAICVFGERKKSSDKVYPKGYVEMLEQQQSQLVSGLQEMYKRLNLANAWKTETLSETNGHPLTHDILAALDLLEIKPDGSGDMELFEEDCQRLQSRLLSEGAKLVHRRGSFSSDSDHSQPPHHSRSVSNSTPSLIHTTSFFPDNYSFGSTASSPTIQSPVQMNPTHRSSLPFAVQPPSATLLQNQHHFLNQTPHPHSPLSNDPQLYQAEWCLPNMSTHNQVIRAKHGHSTDGVMALHQHPQQHSRSFRPHLGLQLHQSHHDHRPRLSHPHQVHSPSVPSPATAAMYDMPLQQQQQQQQQLLLQSQQQALFGSTEFDPNLPMDFVDTFVDSPMAGLRPGLVQNSAVDGFDSMEMEYNRYVEVMT